MTRKKDIEKLQARLARLQLMERSVQTAVAVFKELTDPKGGLSSLRLRHGFAYLAKPDTKESSDRRLPPREERPPASRVMTPRGAALRLMLIALALNQGISKRAGAKARNTRAIKARPGAGYGWVDLLASSATLYKYGKNYLTPQDKQVRHLHSALDGLEAARLVRLGGTQARRDYEHFVLLDETGSVDRSAADPFEYTVPTSREPTFQLPATFITNGWVHVLEDTEILLLLMVACGLGDLQVDESVVIPGGVRLHNYGIGRDGYSTAHVMLSELGLVEVREIGRHADGQVADHGEQDVQALVHRLRLQAEGFEQPAFQTMTQTIKRRLSD